MFGPRVSALLARTRELVSCPVLLLTTSSLAGTPSPGPLRPAPEGAGLRLKKTPAAGHPLPQGGEGRGSEWVLSTIKWDRTLGGSASPRVRLRDLGTRAIERVQRGFQDLLDFRIFRVVSAIRSPMREVVTGRDLPGRSGVRWPRFRTFSMAVSMAFAAASM